MQHRHVERKTPANSHAVNAGIVTLTRFNVPAAAAIRCWRGAVVELRLASILDDLWASGRSHATPQSPDSADRLCMAAVECVVCP